MELVYLWVEDYKNIHNQGFNFSPRFECKFHDEYEKYVDDNGKEKERLKDNCKLDIWDKKKNEYIENFFGENVNITAIVGKNGSGKSSLLECLRFNEYKILVFMDDGVKYFTNKIEINTKVEKKRFNFSIYNFYMNSSIFHMDKMSEHLENKITLNIDDISKKVFNNLNKKEFQLSSLMYIPEKILFLSNKIEDIFKDILKYDYTEKTKIIKDSKFNLYHKFLILVYLYYYNNYIDGMDVHQLKEMKENFKINDIHLANIDANHLESIKDKSFLENSSLLKDFIFNEEKFNNMCFHKDSFSFQKIFELTKDEKEFLIEYTFFYKFDLFDSLERRYNNLSHGEKILFGQLLSIYDILNSKKNEKILFLFDEPDLSLHPNWQKKYFQEVYNLFSQFNKKSHFIFTTHSPFMLSDIPKQNIIFLDKDEKGNCKVVNGLKEKKQTFGANIHTLLSDSFFMEDGLMGEFAKGKIDKAITLLNKEKLDEKDLKYCEQIISIIGEPIVKNQLQRMLDSKRLKKVDEIDKIYEEIELLKHRIEILRKD